MDCINPHTGRPFVKDFFRKYAKGKPCLIRIAAECGYSCDGPETTVLCHLTMAGLKAMGGKLPDLLGAHGCYTCHGLLDGHIRPKTMVPTKDIKLWHHEGVARTIAQLIKDGVLPE